MSKTSKARLLAKCAAKPSAQEVRASLLVAAAEARAVIHAYRHNKPVPQQAAASCAVAVLQIVRSALKHTTSGA